ncbi:hypothetical protein CAEBREN_02464 [Caenorhabditis brenneri]|uniref:Uncharacterized protein n=1 Tax=Caenorhabditis brenneri TaxID=135651 RepID=G0PBD6_CAEBE|nr:hypothetical protein CAEBREN_02464 [Caenorhabditis brenneri]
MLIAQLIESLSEKAVVTALTSSSIIVYDQGELKIYVGFTNNRECVEYTKEVVILLSTDIPQKAQIRDIIVSKNGDYVILEGSRSIFVVRIGTEILFSKPDRLPSEYFCECYPLHDSLLLQNPGLTVAKTRILAEKCDEKSIIAAVLYSDSCIRFYNLQKKFDSLLLSVDFRSYLHIEQDENTTCNTFGLQKTLVSFDLIPPQPKSSHFSLIVVDSDVEFYASFVHFSCFKEGVPPRIHRLEAVDGLPCDPLDLQYIQTSNPRITSIFVLVSGGGILSHLVVFPNEFGEFHPSSVHLNQESRVVELVNAIIPDELSNTTSNKWTGARALRAVSVQLSDCSQDEDMQSDSEDVMHLVIIENKAGQPAHAFNVTTFDSDTWDSQIQSSKGKTVLNKVPKNTKSLEQQLASMQPLTACVISEKVSCEEAIEAALKFFDAVDDRLKKHALLAEAFVERCVSLATSTKSLGERQQQVDDRLIEETSNVEELKARMHATKDRMEAARKGINVLFHRVEENVPLSDNESRIFERLKEHQKMLSDLSILVPKMTLDANELNRMADVVLKKRGAGEETNKFLAVEKNAVEIESLVSRATKLQEDVAQFGV